MGGTDKLLNVLAKGGLIVFDRRQVVSAVCHHQLAGRFVLGMERVQGPRAPGQIEFPEEFARHRNFIGLGVHQRAAQVRTGWAR